MGTTTALIVVASVYLSCAVLLSIGAIGFPVALRAASALGPRAPERWLALGWGLLALALLSPPAWHTAGGTPRSGAPVEIWSGPRLESRAAATVASVSVRWPGSTGAVTPAELLPVQHALRAGLVLLATGALISVHRLLVRRRRLGRLCDCLPVIKRIGTVRICASDEAPVPFAARAHGLAFIVVPTALLPEARKLRLVIAHEAHHHRRGDLHAAAVFGLLRALYFWNPLLALWERAMADLQDFACDRHVLRRLRVSPLEYGRALLWAAESLHGRRYRVRGALGIMRGSRGFLERRILMLNESHVQRCRVRGWLAGTAVTLMMAGTSWAAQGVVADHRVSRADVERRAARLEQRTGFPLPVDEGVVARLNVWVADPASRRSMQRAMERMPRYRDMIEAALRAHGLPPELLGIVMAESAFDNEVYPDRPVEQRSAGIWQIIPRTARQLGLQVSPAIDERLDPGKATEAAAAFLTSLYARYQDWPVAIAAYNAGEKRIDSLAAGATSAAEVRARVLASGDEHARYVRAVIAAIILIDNPSLLE